MSNSVSVDGYLHVEGLEQFGREVFNKTKVRAGMRKVGKLITTRAQMNLALGSGRDGYPVNRTGTTVESVNYSVSRSGFLVRIAPTMTDSMEEFYPAYLHYGVRYDGRFRTVAFGRRRSRPSTTSGRRGWRITPRDNYMTDALADSRAQVQKILADTFAGALLN